MFSLALSPSLANLRSHNMSKYFNFIFIERNHFVARKRALLSFSTFVHLTFPFLRILFRTHISKISYNLPISLSHIQQPYCTIGKTCAIFTFVAKDDSALRFHIFLILLQQSIVLIFCCMNCILLTWVQGIYNYLPQT